MQTKLWNNPQFAWDSTSSSLFCGYSIKQMQDDAPFLFPDSKVVNPTKQIPISELLPTRPQFYICLARELVCCVDDSNSENSHCKSVWLFLLAHIKRLITWQSYYIFSGQKCLLSTSNQTGENGFQMYIPLHRGGLRVTAHFPVQHEFFFSNALLFFFKLWDQVV